MAGYSGTPLPKKLGIKPGSRVLLDGEPEGFDDVLGVAPVDSGPADVIVSFHTERATLEPAMPQLRDPMDPAAGLWIAWPKRRRRSRPT